MGSLDHSKKSVGFTPDISSQTQNVRNHFGGYFLELLELTHILSDKFDENGSPDSL